MFLNVMLNEGGLPLPALPAIVRAGALFAQYPNVCAAEGIIPGAVAAHLAKINAVTGMYSGHQETIVYCACPNEASAAMAAKHLRRAGFQRIRPLLGGIDAWVETGHPIERHASRMGQQI